MSMRDQDSQRFHEAAQRAIGRCAATGPWGYVCTEYAGHDFAHYDAGLDASWTDRWHDDFEVPVENHPFDCRCNEHSSLGATVPLVLNPDCRDGKHHACNGDGWDMTLDQPAACGCSCHASDVTLPSPV